MTLLEQHSGGAVPSLGSTRPEPARRRRSFSLGRYTGVVIALLVVCTYLALTQPVFLTWGNITNIVAGNSVVLLLAVGATFVIISGGIDLSTASAAAVCGMVLGVALEAGLPAIVAILAPLVVGVVIGLINGALISFARISFLVVTLGMMSILASLALVMNNGRTISVFSLDGFQPLYTFVNGSVLGVPYLMIFDALVVLGAGFILQYTAYGRSLFAVGSNSEAARLNGVNVALVVLLVYVIAGIAASLASIVQVARLTGAAPQVDATLLMSVIAAVLIGGTAFTGGEGGVLGTLIGVMFLGVIQNGMTLSEISSFWQGTVTGTILILAVGLSATRSRVRRKKARPKVDTPVG